MFAVEDQNLLDKWVTGIRTVVKRYMQARFQGGKKSSRQSSSSSIESSSSSRGKLPEGGMCLCCTVYKCIEWLKGSICKKQNSDIYVIERRPNIWFLFR